MGSPFQYTAPSMRAATIKTGPPTTLTVTIVVAAERAYMILLPKLSERLLSMPAKSTVSYIYQKMQITFEDIPSKSFPNRLRTRPRDTVSWNRISANKMDSKSLL